MIYLALLIWVVDHCVIALGQVLQILSLLPVVKIAVVLVV